jgi:hypothetical protein
VKRIRALGAATACAVVTTFSGPQHMLAAMLRLPASNAPRIAPDTVRWGVGMNGAAGLFPPSGHQFNYEYCQQQGSCPTFTPGLRGAGYHVTKMLRTTQGNFGIAFSASQTPGVSTYDQIADTSGKDQSPGGFAGGLTNSASVDVITLHSTTLPRGTPVTLGVGLTLTNPKNVLSCTSQNFSATLQSGGSGVGAQGGTNLAIVGYCTSRGSFEYHIGNFLGPMGTTDPGTLQAQVGQPFGVFESVGVTANAGCEVPNEPPCSQHFVVELGGTIRWTITSLPPGVTYTTASGVRYN